MKKNFLITIITGISMLMINWNGSVAKSYHFENQSEADTLENRYHDPGMEKVVNADRMSAGLEKAGYPVIQKGRYDSDDGTYIYHDTQDALGVVIELLHSDE